MGMVTQGGSFLAGKTVFTRQLDCWEHVGQSLITPSGASGRPYVVKNDPSTSVKQASVHQRASFSFDDYFSGFLREGERRESSKLFPTAGTLHVSLPPFW